VALYYVAHRLFAAHDRALGAYIASRLARLAGAGAVFLPFCDTDEENLVSDCKGRRLFELDCSRLRQISGMIAVLHGPSLDDGVCMEMGFAVALGVPIVVVSTDFQTYGPEPKRPGFAFAEPLLEQLAVAVERGHRLGPPRKSGGSDRFRQFLGQNLDPVSSTVTRAINALISSQPARVPRTQNSPYRNNLAFIEPSPYVADDMWAAVADTLHARGWTVHVAKRFRVGVDTVEATRADWAAVEAAGLAVVDARGPETPPGAALIAGACTATGRPVLAAHTGTWQTFADGREPNWRNLMIQYAVNARFADINEFTVAMDRLCPLP
jgi:nucleoside 2-deoxyribosyltransferase-like protein